MNYIRDDAELYDAILFTLGTTNGSFIASSTPGSSDSLFYKICLADEYADFSRHKVSWREAVEPNGPLKASILEKIRKQLETNPWRWTREMEAEFAEDEETFFPLSLLTSCVSYELKTYDESIALMGEIPPAGSYYVGCDLGKKQDHSAVAVAEKKDGHVNPNHIK